MERDRSPLLDIVRAGELVEEFRAGMDKAAFLKDFKTQSAILHQLMVMGEAVKRFTSEFDLYCRSEGKIILNSRDILP